MLPAWYSSFPWALQLCLQFQFRWDPQTLPYRSPISCSQGLPPVSWSQAPPPQGHLGLRCSSVLTVTSQGQTSVPRKCSHSLPLDRGFLSFPSLPDLLAHSRHLVQDVGVITCALPICCFPLTHLSLGQTIRPECFLSHSMPP